MPGRHWDYAQDQLSLAAKTLVGPRTIQQRLLSAYDQCIATLHPKDFPAELSEDFKQLDTTLFGVTTRIESTRDDEVQRCAEDVVALLMRLVSATRP